MTEKLFHWCLALLVTICVICPSFADAAAKKPSEPTKCASGPIKSASPLLHSLEEAVNSCKTSTVEQILAERPPVNACVVGGRLSLLTSSPVLHTSIYAFNAQRNYNARECANTFVVLVKGGASLWALDFFGKPIVASLDSFILLDQIGKEALDLDRRSAMGNTPLTLMIGENGKRLEAAMATVAKYGVKELERNDVDLMQLASYYMFIGNVNAKSKKGHTAAMAAAELGYTHIVWSLAERKADFSIKDQDGQTALDYARKSGNIETITMVRKAMSGNVESAPLLDYDPKWWSAR